jgi:putative ABC transport system ATP-binding protein
MIRTSQLSYRYGTGKDNDHGSGPNIAFADIDVPQGTTLLLRGASGSGKSTWLALAAGLLRAGGGQITVAGQDLGLLKSVALDAWRAKTIGFLPQKLHLSEALTVQGNLAMAQWAAGSAAGVADDARSIAQVLTTLGLSDLANRKPSQLSGGQAQRVALARAVLLAPKVILADEPTASLDDEAAHAALALLQATAQSCNATLVIATHDARVAQALPSALEVRLPLLRPDAGHIAEKVAV